uniref:Uncharacterized protein n=1 Tax=Anopheles albimanus TaxID=7167 RepID=A0A182FZI6_ANOAL
MLRGARLKASNGKVLQKPTASALTRYRAHESS